MHCQTYETHMLRGSRRFGHEDDTEVEIVGDGRVMVQVFKTLKFSHLPDGLIDWIAWIDHHEVVKFQICIFLDIETLLSVYVFT